jgi:hypothetical protein
MQMAITFMAVVAGMIFSLSVALLAEELIFGQVFRLFFARQQAEMKPGQKLSDKLQIMMVPADGKLFMNDVLRNMTVANANGQTEATEQAEAER